MKKLLFIFTFFTGFALYADECSQECSNDCKSLFPSLCELPVINFDWNYIDVKRTKFRSSDVEDQHLKYRELDLSFTYLHAFNSVNGFTLGAGYIGSEVKWNENPFFDETHFGYVTFTATAISMMVDDWLWKLGEIVLIDTAEFDMADYALYQTFLFGKYALCKPIFLNVGFILELGLNKGKIWPVLGVDFYCSEKLHFHAVYPLDISAEYYFLPELSLEASCRFLRNRHRVKNNEPLPMGIFEYRTTGAELDLNYKPIDAVLVTAYIGTTFDGDLKITDRNNHHATHEKFRGSLYVGLSGNVSF